MEKSFWIERWQSREIGFHEGLANDLLATHWNRLEQAAPARVFVPLCGKTRDIHWLLQQGHRVAGAEFSETAVAELFEELGLSPSRHQQGALTRYSAPDIDIFAGDVFDLDASQLGPVDAIYDRAALVALPAETRRRYTRHLKQISGNAPQFLITFDYDQSQLPGPPFAVPLAEVTEHYGAQYQVECIEARSVAGGLKGQCEASECAWVLRALAD